MRPTWSLSAAPSPATASLTCVGRVLDDLAPGRVGLGHGQPAGLADRHGGAHVDLEEDPLDRHHVGPELGEEAPQLGLELGQAGGQRVGRRRCG